MNKQGNEYEDSICLEDKESEKEPILSGRGGRGGQGMAAGDNHSV